MRPARPAASRIVTGTTVLSVETIADGEFLKRVGNTVVSAAAGGGSSDHATLSNLPWTSSGHTGTASRLAGFSGAGAAAYYQIGSGAGTVCAGDDSRLSDSRAPSGAASGDLSGNYPGPTVAKIGGVAVTVDTDGTLAANSDAKLATQKATKTYADAGYRPGGTDVAVADGGTGASTAAGARLNLGLATPPIFGSGRDGALVFDGAGAVTGYTRSGSTYTADRDVFGTNATISAGVTVKPAGFRLGLTGTLTITATGSIQANGNNASGITAGSGGASGGPGTLHAASANGANGRSTVGAGSGGGSVSHAIGGAGGNGGAAAGGSPAGGGGGSVTAPTAAQGDLRDPPYLAWGQLANTGGTGWQSADTGGGGGAGGHDGVSGNSGGGGGSGGALWLACDTIDNAGSITANGGNGGAATGTDNGGGGGGGGGWILLVYRATSGSGLGTVTATKGTGGAGSGGGASGANGSDGVAYTLQLT